MNSAGAPGRVRLVDLPVISDPRGDLTFVEGGVTCPSTSAASITSTTSPSTPSAADMRTRSSSRSSSPCRAASASCSTTARRKSEHWLRDPRKGLYVDRHDLARDRQFLAQGAVCMVLASNLYDEADYYRDYDDFLAAAAGRSA